MNKNYSFAQQHTNNAFAGSTPAVNNPITSNFSSSAVGNNTPVKSPGVHAGSAVSYSFTPSKA